MAGSHGNVDGINGLAPHSQFVLADLPALVMGWPSALVLMLLGHYVADKVLQPKWFSLRKRSKHVRTRWLYLSAHGALHGCMVGLATSSLVLATAEAVAHAIIDRLRAKKWYGMLIDQMLHILCKAIWLACMLWL